MKKGLLAAGILLAGLVVLMLLDGGAPGPRLVPDQVIKIRRLPELSGLAWHPERGTLFAVTDEGALAELDLAGKVRTVTKLGAFDLEGVALPPDTSTLYLIDEKRSLLLVVAIENPRIIARHRVANLGSASNDAYEGIAVDPRSPRVLLLNERRPTALVALDLGSRGVTSVDLPTKAAGRDLLLSPDGEEVVVLADKGLRLFSTAGAPLGPWHRLAKGRLAEGLALVPGKGLYVCTDASPSRLLVFRSLNTWAALRDTLAK